MAAGRCLKTCLKKKLRKRVQNETILLFKPEKWQRLKIRISEFDPRPVFIVKPLYLKGTYSSGIKVTFRNRLRSCFTLHPRSLVPWIHYLQQNPKLPEAWMQKKIASVLRLQLLMSYVNVKQSCYSAKTTSLLSKFWLTSLSQFESPEKKKTFAVRDSVYNMPLLLTREWKGTQAGMTKNVSKNLSTRKTIHSRNVFFGLSRPSFRCEE